MAVDDTNANGPPFDAEALEAVLMRFEVAWNGDANPQVDAYLTGTGPVRSLVLRELIYVDLECRLKRGESVRVEAYLQRYPQLVDDIPFCLDLLAREFYFRQRTEPKLGFAEYEQRFPKFGSELRKVVATIVPRSRPGRISRFSARLNCPHCHNPIEIVAESAQDEVVCPSCGSSLKLDGGQTLTWDKQRLPHIEQFELLEAVGRGAFGTVYKARDKQLQRLVAIKIPRSGVLATDEDEDRFVREARNAAQLQHTGIVTVYSVGRTETFPYLISEFVDGVTLAQYLTAKRFTMREAARLTQDIALGLQHAHEQGVIHRDLKPSNIMLTPGGQPRIMDFGFAKRDAGEITMTLDGQVLGTPAYMSPEQAKGQSHNADARSDVYSVGVILFQLLTGELPFRGEVRMLLHQVLHDEPPSPRNLNHLIPRDLDTICLKCLAKEPQRRYSSAGELSADLGRYLAGQPIRARPVSRIERAWRWCRRNPAIALLSATVVVVLLTGTAVSSFFALQSAARNRDLLMQAIQARKQRLVADTLRKQAEGDRHAAVAAGTRERIERLAAQDSERRAKAAISFLVSIFGTADSVLGVQGTGLRPTRDQDRPLTAREVLDLGRQRIDKELSDEPLTRATLLDAMGLAYVGLGEIETAQRSLEQALKIREAKLKLPHPDLLASRLSRGIWQHITGNFDAAEKQFRDVLAAQEQLQPPDPLAAARTKFHLALVVGELQRFPEALKLLNEALEVRRAKLGEKHPDVTVIRTLLMLGKLNEKMDILELLNSLDVQSPDVAVFLVRGILQFNTLRLHRQNGRFDDAVKGYRPLLADAEKVLGPGHPVCLAIRFDIAGIMQQQGDYIAAEAMARETLAKLPRVLARNTRVAEVHFKLGQFARDRGDDQETEVQFRKAIQTARSPLGNDYPWPLQARDELAGWYYSLGKVVAAEAFCRETMELLKDNPIAVARARQLLPHIFLESGKIDEAVVGVRTAYEASWQARNMWPHTTEVFRHGGFLMVCLRMKGDFAEAKKIEAALRKQVDEVAAGLAAEENPGYLRMFAANLAERQKWEQAERLHRWAAAGARKRNVPRHPGLADELNAFAHFLLERGRADDLVESCDIFREILDIRRTRLGTEHLKTTGTALDLALALHARGETNEALVLARDVHEQRRKIYGDQDLRTQNTAIMLARIVEAHDPDQAIKLAREALSVHRGLWPSTHSEIYRVVIELGNLLERRREIADAAAHYETALRESEQAWPKGSWRHAEISSRLGHCYLKQQRLDEAEPLLLQGAEAAEAAWLPGDARLNAVMARVVQYYEATNNPTAAERCRRLSQSD